jgi:hypothetical protein
LAGRTNYSDDEWNALRRAMISSAVIVSMAEGGGSDMIKEMLAVSEHLLGARRGHRSQLVRELADIQRFTSGFQTGMSAAQYEGPALESIRSAMALVTARTPAEAPAFRQFLLGLAETAANANKEGGLMGVGGSRISAAEASAIARVRQALGED